MNIEIANRLVQMRKDRGLSQEALAEELGISRQAVSKWERAESSPDTSNLITLAKLYNVSLDELLDTDQEKFESADPLNGADGSEKSVDPEEKEKNDDDFVRINLSGVHVKDGDDEVRVGWNGVTVLEDGKEVVNVGRGGVVIDGEDYSRSWRADGLISLLVVAAYLALGVFCSAWHPGWLVFLLIPILTSIGTAIRKRNASEFAYPVLVFAGILTAIIVFGMPWTTWFALILIPIFSEILKLFGGKKRRKKVFSTDEDGNIKIFSGDDWDIDVDVSFNGKDED